MRPHDLKPCGCACDDVGPDEHTRRVCATNLGDHMRNANDLFMYDLMGRPVSVMGSYAQAYAYDAISNLTLTGKAGMTQYYSCR